MMKSNKKSFSEDVFVSFLILLIGRLGKSVEAEETFKSLCQKGSRPRLIHLDEENVRFYVVAFSEARWLRMIPNLATYTALMKAYAKVGITFQLPCLTRNS